MPYTTLTAGTTITAAWANANVRDQTVVPFATTAARDSAITSPVQGMVAMITDTDVMTVYNGSAWIEYGRWGAWATYIPAIVQLGAATSTVIHADWMRFGSQINVNFRLEVTGSGTSGNNITVTLPVNADAQWVSAFATIGIGSVYDASSGNRYKAEVVLASASTIAFVRTDTTDTSLIGAIPAFGLAATDVLQASICYQVV